LISKDGIVKYFLLHKKHFNLHWLAVEHANMYPGRVIGMESCVCARRLKGKAGRK